MRTWRVKASYSFLNLDLDTRPGSSDLTTVRSTEESSPGHQVTLQSLLQLPRYTELDLSYRYTSELPAQMVSAYHTADVRLGWSPLEHFDFSVVGRDLLQPHHAEFGGGVEVKRSVYGKITWSR
jgi:iron complex outermembrane receptor protein